MTVSLKLGAGLHSCPANWVKFIKDLRDRGVEQTVSEGFEVDTLNQELEPFKAQYINSDGDNRSRVDFANEACYTLFILKYGGE